MNTCPHCGKPMLDPYGLGNVIHDVERCERKQPKYLNMLKKRREVAKKRAGE